MATFISVSLFILAGILLFFGLNSILVKLVEVQNAVLNKKNYYADFRPDVAEVVFGLIVLGLGIAFII